MSDTIYIKPGETLFSDLDNAPTGLVGTVGVTVIQKSDQSIVSARTVEGIVEFPVNSGHYQFSGKGPSTEGSFTVFWDWGGGPESNATDDLVVTSKLPSSGPPSYDITTDIGKVRLLISDVGGADGNSFLFVDEEISMFLALREDIRLAAAEAFRTIAGNEVQVAKRIKFLELETNGPAVSAELIKLADKLEEAVEDDSDVEFAAMAISDFNLDLLTLQNWGWR
jgi:hypothetical protein